jgi:hypothetical protein
MLALLTSPDITAAAEKAETSRSTVYRHLNDPVFAAELAKRRNAMLDSAVDSLKTHSGRAADTLGALLDTSDGRLRRQAAKDVLEFSFKILEGRDVLQRLTDIETRLAEKKQ